MKTFLFKCSLAALTIAFAMAFTGCKKEDTVPDEGKLLTVVNSRVATMNSIDAFWMWTGMAAYVPGCQAWLDPVVSKFLEGNPIVEKKYVIWEGKAPVGNEKVPASGIVLGKKSIFEGKEKAKGVILYNHGTQFAQIETPSGGFDINGLFALDGFVVVAADYYGFGATQSRPQAYLAYYNAVTALELLSAAVRDFGLQGIPQYVCGHSEGGMTSAAVAQEWSANGSAYPDVELTRVYAVNGPYDIHHTFSEFRDLDYAPGIIGGLALASISYNMILGEDLYKNFVDLVKNNNGENRAQKYLTSGDYGNYGSPLVFGEYYGMPNAQNALETGILTDEALKELTTPGLDYGTFPGFSRWGKLSHLFDIDVLNEQLPKYKEKFNLCDKPFAYKCPFVIWNSTEDVMVQDYNSDPLFENASGDITYITGNMGDHVASAYYFIQYFIEDITGKKFQENYVGHTYCNNNPHEEAFDCQNKKFYNTLDPANKKYIYNLNSTENYSRVVKTK